MNRPQRTLSLAALAAALTACSSGGDQAAVAPDCGAAVLVELAGGTYCVASLPIIETGFHCPPELPYEFSGDKFKVCSANDGMSDGEVGAVGLEAGFGPTSKKLDIVMVVDSTSSMCGEQNAIADAADLLATELSRLDIDARVAVTTDDMGCEPGGSAGLVSRGRFNFEPATSFPPSCQHHEAVACMDDAACAGLGDGPWICRHPSTAACVENPNGSINSACWLRCTDDAGCRDALGDPRAVCQKPSANPGDWGCLIPPRTASCPDVLASGHPWLERPHLADLGCIAMVGVNQQLCHRYEQDLGAAWAAIDPLGPNAQQAADFLRPDAHLAVLIVTDADDCSVADGQTIGEVDYQTCALLGDTTAGGPLVPAAELAERFIALKAPDREVFAAVTSGDSTAETTAEREADRASYLASLTDPALCHHQASICDGDAGPAYYGARLAEFAAAFGANGAFVNVCDEAPMVGLVRAFIGKLEARLAAP